MIKEKTLAIIKPDVFQKNCIGKILSMWEKKGLSIIGIKTIHLTISQVQAFYEEHKQKKFFSSLVEFMTSYPIIVICLEGKNAINSSRKVIGATDPNNAEAGTIRKIFGTSIENNAVHGSDSFLSAEREIKFFFPGLLP